MLWHLVFAVQLTRQYGHPLPIPAVCVLGVSGPAALAGIFPGDLLCAVNGRQVGCFDDLTAIVSSVCHAPLQY